MQYLCARLGHGFLVLMGVSALTFLLAEAVRMALPLQIEPAQAFLMILAVIGLADALHQRAAAFPV